MSHVHKTALALFALFVAIYCATSGPRLRQPSNATHFVIQADLWRHGRIELGHQPPNSDDWAEVEYLHLKDGRTVAGTFLRAQPSSFRTTLGKTLQVDQGDIANRWKKFYNSFPPFPTLLFLPFVAAFGLLVKDVLITAVVAALAPALLYLILRHLAARGDSTRSAADDLWLVGLFGLGTVYYYTAVAGGVWYTAHVVATVLAALFVLAAFEARHPIVAGLCIGALLGTRPHIAWWAVFLLFERLRLERSAATRPPGAAPPPGRLRTLVAFALPILLLGGASAGYNWLRFHQLGEFGHSYLNVRWTGRIQHYGLTNYAFLSRNLTCALTLLPKITNRRPYVQLSWHGMSLLVTTPAYLYLLWPRVTSGLHSLLWLVVGPIALAGLLYQNDGWVQFGYRFSNDFALALIMLLAIGGRPLTRTFKGVVLAGLLVNLFGAITFGRMWQYYFDGFFPIPPGDL